MIALLIIVFATVVGAIKEGNQSASIDDLNRFSHNHEMINYHIYQKAP